MKCQNCNKKISIASQSVCKWCEIVYCITCRHLETHNCSKIEIYRQSEKLNLEKKLIKTEDIKIIKI